MTWKTVRVFISSTFRDMHAERDWLVKRVFPALRQRLEPHRIHLLDIDLRWGITTEQADNDQVLGLCLQQIDTCRPFFIGLLGERYGWVPATFPVDVASRYGWTQRQTGKSVTELEILHGVLNDPAMRDRALFCFRSPAFLEDIKDDLQRRRFVEEPTDEELLVLGDIEAARRAAARREQLAELKQRIRAQSPPLPLYDGYPCAWDGADSDPATGEPGRVTGLSAFGAWIVEKLERAILEAEELAPHLAAVRRRTDDPLADERGLHERFIDARTRVYVGRQDLQNALRAFASGADDRLCLVTGPSGTGKSAALAKFVVDWRSDHPADIVIPHFVGASANSTSVRDTLAHLAAELKDALGLKDALEREARGLADQVRGFMHRVPRGRRVVIVIDGLNQMDRVEAGGEGQALIWLPSRTPPNVRLIVSSIDEPMRARQPLLDAARARDPVEIRVGAMSDEDRLGILREVPSMVAKTLDAQQIRLLLANEATRNPLFLLVALEELRGFGSFEKLNLRIASLPQQGDTLTAIFEQVIERLEDDFEAATVKTVLSLLASARLGLSEREMLDLVEGPHVPVDQSAGDLFPILRQLRPFLHSRGPLLDFFHRNFAAATRRFYLTGGEARAAAHARLARYFRAQADPDGDGRWPNRDPRPLAEIPFQLTAQPAWPELSATLSNLCFVEAKCQSGLTFDLVADYDAARHVPADGPDVHERVRAFDHFVRQHAAMIAADPAQVLPFAHNHARSGPVAEAAERLLREPGRGWRRRSAIELVERPPFVSRPALIYTATGHTGEVTSLALSADGVRAISGSLDGTARVWNVPMGLHERTIEAHTRGVNGVALTPDGRTAATAGADGLVKIWRVDSGDCLRTIAAEPAEALAVALDATGTRVWIGGLEGAISLWDVQTGTRVLEMHGHFGPVSSLMISADGSTLVSGSWDCMARVWSAADGRALACLEGHAVPVHGVAVDARGRRIASCAGLPADADGRVGYQQLEQSDVRIWESAAEIARVTPHEVANRGGTMGVVASVVHGVALSGDGEIAASAGYDRKVAVASLDGGFKQLAGHDDSVRAVAMNGSGTLAVTGGSDRTVRVWDLEGHTAPAQSVFRIGTIGAGKRVRPAARAKLIWRNPRIRLMVLLPILSILIGFLIVPAFQRLLAVAPGNLRQQFTVAGASLAVLLFIEWRAMLKLDSHVWRRDLLPPAAWWLASLIMLPLWALFPVLDCPRCGRPIAGRRYMFSCVSCGFRDRRLPDRPGRRQWAS